MILTAAAMMAACTGGGEPEPIAAHPLDGGWPALLLDRPADFDTVMGAQKEAWIAFHKADWKGAAEGLGTGEPAARSWEELARFEGDLAGMAAVAWETTFATWEKRAGIPEGSALPLVAELAAREAGDAVRADAWKSKAGTVSLDGPCVAAHATARQAHALDGLADCIGKPLVVETAAEGHQRELWDPLAYGTLRAVYADRAAAARASATSDPARADALAAVLFSCHWAWSGCGETTEGRAAESGFQDSPPPTTDDAQWARERVRALDAALDEWSAARTDRASPEGAALFQDLRAVPLFRSRLLVDWARAALRQAHPHMALAYAQMALDVEHGREVGPLNPPSLFVVLAHANLATGRTREALDALEVLSAGYPEVRALDETVGDLAILQGLDRVGDSKEN